MLIPIAPERDVGLLLQRNQLNISQLKGSVKGLEAEHDDIWILRFLLSSKGDISKAEAAINTTLAWRAEKAEWMKVGIASEI